MIFSWRMRIEVNGCPAGKSKRGTLCEDSTPEGGVQIAEKLRQVLA